MLMRLVVVGLLLTWPSVAVALVVPLPCTHDAIVQTLAEALTTDHDLELPDGHICTTRGLVIDGVTGLSVHAAGATLQLEVGTLTLDVATPVIRISRSSNIRVTGLRIDGNRRAQTTFNEWNAGVWVESSTNVWLDKLVIFQTAGDGVQVGGPQGAVNVYLTNNFINDVRPTDAYGNARQGISVAMAYGVTIQGNIFGLDGSGDVAIDLEPDAPYGWVGNVTVVGNSVAPTGWRWAFGMNGTGDYGTVVANGNIWGGHPCLVTKPQTLTAVGNAP